MENRMKEICCDISKVVEDDNKGTHFINLRILSDLGQRVCRFVCTQGRHSSKLSSNQTSCYFIRFYYHEAVLFTHTNRHMCPHIKQRSAEEKNQRAMRRNKTKYTTDCLGPQANLAASVNKSLLSEICVSHKASITAIFSQCLSFFTLGF